MEEETKVAVLEVEKLGCWTVNKDIKILQCLVAYAGRKILLSINSVYVAGERKL